MPNPTVLQRQIKSTGLTVEQVADIASVPLDLLKRAVAGELYLKQPEAEQVAGLIWSARVTWAKYHAEQAGVEFDRPEAEREAFEQYGADLKEQVAELEADVAERKAAAFMQWLRDEEERLGIEIVDLDAAYSIFESVQKAQGA